MNKAFGPLERKIARRLRKIPRLKNWTKAFYAALAYLKHRQSFSYKSKYKIYPVCENSQESFFGYYDKSPASSDGWVLCHLSEGSTRKRPSPKRSVSVALLEPGGKEPTWKAKTEAFNWQQGARAHWLDRDFFVFNDFDRRTQNFISRVFSKKGLREEARYDKPIQDSFGTDFFISINYRRLAILSPDYGYFNLPTLSKEEITRTKEDGIWKIESGTGKSVLLISINDICAQKPEPEFDRAKHSINHTMISPAGKKILFIHRYYLRGVRKDRLLLADAVTGMLNLLADRGTVSHCFWADERTVLGYLRGPDDEEAYWLIDTETGNFKRFSGKETENFEDGHPHVHGTCFVTDTYPDKARMQHLILANLKTGRTEELGMFFHGFSYWEQTRCDLHPRFSPNGKSIYFDSVFSGKRMLYRMDLDK